MQHNYFALSNTTYREKSRLLNNFLGGFFMEQNKQQNRNKQQNPQSQNKKQNPAENKKQNPAENKKQNDLF